MAAMKAATCGSTFAHAHRDSGIRCSSSQKSAGPAGRQLLREARAAPGRAMAELLGSLPAPASTGFVTRTKRSPKLESAGQGQSQSRCIATQLQSSAKACHTRAPQRRSFGAPFTHRAQDVVSIGADSRQCVQAAPCPAAPSPSKPLASAADGVRPPVRPPAADSARSAAPPQRWTTGTRTTATWRAQT